jgi:hypothetical protein
MRAFAAHGHDRTSHRTSHCPSLADKTRRRQPHCHRANNEAVRGERLKRIKYLPPIEENDHSFALY